MYTALLYVSRPFGGQPIQEKLHYLFFFHSALRYDSTDTPPRYFPAEVFVKPSRQLVAFRRVFSVDGWRIDFHLKPEARQLSSKKSLELDLEQKRKFDVRDTIILTRYLTITNLSSIFKFNTLSANYLVSQLSVYFCQPREHLRDTENIIYATWGRDVQHRPTSSCFFQC